MPPFDFDDIVNNLGTVIADGIPHENNTFVVAVATSINPEAAGAGASIGPVAVIMDIIVLDGNTWLGKIREYNAAACRDPNFKAIYRDVGIRRLTRSTRAHNAIWPSGTTIKDRNISAAIIAEGDWVALASVDI